MLKKLKRRFVAISMLLVSVVFIFFYLVTCAALVVNVNIDIEEVLRNYATANIFEELPNIGEGNEENSMLVQLSGNVCVVSVSEITGIIEILDSSRAYISENILEQAVNSAMSSDEQFAHLPGVNLFFYKASNVFGTKIAFADSTHYFSYLKDILTAGTLFFAIALIVLFIVNLGLANMCLKPVEKTWAQQQDFIADASHELKTPLTVILTNGNILQSHPDKTVGEQMQWVESTNEEASHMKELVDKLLLLAKTDNMRQNNQFADVNMTELATRLALQYDPVAYEKGITLTTHIEDNIHITGDQTALNQMVHILLDNAVKYAGMGGEVELFLTKRQNCVYLSSKNTGTPIPPEDLPHIFERFYRSDKVRTSGSGYGLGLAICKNLAEQHRADISVTSNAVTGTVFTVKFRLGHH